MRHTTTLLIVLVLSADPAGSLACELWCSTPAAQDHHRAIGCHDASRHSLRGRHVTLITSTPRCHDAAAIAPFVSEARQTESAQVASSHAALFAAGSVGPEDEATIGGCAFIVRPPRPPSSRAVLRV